MLRDVAVHAGIGHVTAHQPRHTLGTQAVNRGMSLDAIAALLGHRDLSMTKVYANPRELHQAGANVQVAC